MKIFPFGHCMKHKQFLQKLDNPKFFFKIRGKAYKKLSPTMNKITEKYLMNNPFSTKVNSKFFGHFLK